MPTKDAETCRHVRAGRRGSDKFVDKAYCINRGTYVGSVARSIAKACKEDGSQPWISAEEQALVDGVGDHSTITNGKLLDQGK